eukprot:CAMPEP_0170105160 /NCGR_PEP_ID=MMETSP0020_2-20130122/4595_1 /TAXON_ID=98059 /ORGANISM="Dinobryon sp., Strain UTEXLB2267" /LENGTH=1038 /DNA_ID=CAMNT_0010329207 /DNA_START=394 /DNA_END=3510 /DNA_ORIENTATION=-
MPYSRKQSKRTFHRTLQYTIPEAIADHIFAVFNTIEYPTPILNKVATTTSSLSVSSSTSGTITLKDLNERYKIRNNTGSKLVTQSVFSTFGNAFSQADLRVFQTINNIPIQRAIDPYNKSVSATSCEASNLCKEGNFDLQYMMGIAQQTSTSFDFYLGDSSSLNDPLIQWCIHAAQTNISSHTLSISFAALEEGRLVMTSFNTEALKLSVRGVTIVASSGDYGVNSKCGCGYIPLFPASSPYVVAVGATMGPEQGIGAREVACQKNKGGDITSGGGFSNLAPQPQWQKAAVKTYFDNIKKANFIPFGGNLYNRSGRAYPDISFAGYNYEYINGKSRSGYSGTSCSAPVFAAMITLINSKRKSLGMPTVGFINPLLYIYADKLKYNDIMIGANTNYTLDREECDFKNDITCRQGFITQKGWDPVTGWGSIDFPNLLAFFINNTYSFPSPVPCQRPGTSSEATLKPSSRHPSKAGPTTLGINTIFPTKSISPTVVKGSMKPTFAPKTVSPTNKPSRFVSLLPTKSSKPTSLSPRSPTITPTKSKIPTKSPTRQPIFTVSARPSTSITSLPTRVTNFQFSKIPSLIPSKRPSLKPSSSKRSMQPSTSPTVIPTSTPSVRSASPPNAVTRLPTIKITSLPSTRPSSFKPSSKPTKLPTVSSSNRPTIVPSRQPTYKSAITNTPFHSGAAQVSTRPSLQPSSSTTLFPSRLPSIIKSLQPTSRPSPSAPLISSTTQSPSLNPTRISSKEWPTQKSTFYSTTKPNTLPTSLSSTFSPVFKGASKTLYPTKLPSTTSVTPTLLQSQLPTIASTLKPSNHPTRSPSTFPSGYPSSNKPTTSPSMIPTTTKPSQLPSKKPSQLPTLFPTALETKTPSFMPSFNPTISNSRFPTTLPSVIQSKPPSATPSSPLPSSKPSPLTTVIPSFDPTGLLSLQPTSKMTEVPSKSPSMSPTILITILPSELPTLLPTEVTSQLPTLDPTASVTIPPSEFPTILPIDSPSLNPSTSMTIQSTEIPSVTPPFMLTSEYPTCTPVTVSPSEETVSKA